LFLQLNFRVADSLLVAVKSDYKGVIFAWSLGRKAHKKPRLAKTIFKFLNVTSITCTFGFKDPDPGPESLELRVILYRCWN
jgi:hypothetical protein